MNDKLRAAHDKLQEAVAEIVSGDDWKRMLKVASKLPPLQLQQPPDDFPLIGPGDAEVKEWPLTRENRVGRQGIEP